MQRKDCTQRAFGAALLFSWINGQYGIVVGWNSDNKRYDVKLNCDGSIKQLKPVVMMEDITCS